MKKTLTLFTCAMLALLTAGIARAADTHDDDVAAIKKNEAQWNQDFATKSLDKLVAHYTDDAVLMDSGMPASKGKAAIRKTFQEFLADPALSLKFQASRVDVSKSGDLAYTQGSYQMTMTDPATKKPTKDHGSYVTVYRKQADGSWKAVSDVAVSEVQQAPSAAPAAGSKK